MLTVLILLAAAGLAAFLRAKGDRHRLGGATDLAGSLEPLMREFNEAAEDPRLLMVLSPACPVCFAGAETVRDELLRRHENLQVLVVWMEALPFDITRNPARRVEAFAGEPRMSHFYDMQQVSGRALQEHLDWQDESLPWDVFLLYPPGVVWSDSLPEPMTWFHQREEANPDHYFTGAELTRTLHIATEAVTH